MPNYYTQAKVRVSSASVAAVSLYVTLRLSLWNILDGSGIDLIAADINSGGTKLQIIK